MKNRLALSLLTASIILVCVTPVYAQNESTSSALLAQNTTAAPQQGQVLGLFDGILDFIRSALGISQPVDANCADTAKDLSDPLVPKAYNRDAGKAPCVAPVGYIDLKLYMSGSTEVNLPPPNETVKQNVTVDLSRNLQAGQSVPFHNVSDHSPDDNHKAKRNVLRAYLGGSSNTYIQDQDLIKTWVSNGSSDDLPYEQLAGVQDKISPFECRSSVGTWQPCEVVRREEVLRALFRGYACSWANAKKNPEFNLGVDDGYYCNHPERAHDYTIAYEYCAPDGKCNLDGGYVGTWFSIEPLPNATTRPYKLGEMACTVLPPMYDLSPDQQARICTYLIGPEFGAQKISPTSYYGRTIFGNNLWKMLSLGKDAVFNPDKIPSFRAAFWYIPTAIIEDSGGNAKERVNPGGLDEFINKLLNPNWQPPEREQPIAIPGITTSTNYMEYVSAMTSPYEHAVKCPDLKHPISQQVPQETVGGPIVDAVGGVKFDTASYTGIDEVKLTGPPIDPQNPNAKRTTTHTVTREVSVKMPVTREMERLMKATNNEKCGFAPLMNNKEIADSLQETLSNGGKAAELPTAINSTCGGNLSCSSNEYRMPWMGGYLVSMNEGLKKSVPGQGAQFTDAGEVVKLTLPFETLNGGAVNTTPTSPTNNVCKVVDSSHVTTAPINGTSYITDGVIALANEVSKRTCTPTEVLIGFLAGESLGSNFNNTPDTGDPNESICRTALCLQSSGGVLGPYSFTESDFQGYASVNSTLYNECIAGLSVNLNDGVKTLTAPAGARIMGHAMCAFAADFWRYMQLPAYAGKPACSGANKRQYSVAELGQAVQMYAMKFCDTSTVFDTSSPNYSFCQSVAQKQLNAIAAFSGAVAAVTSQLNQCTVR